MEVLRRPRQRQGVPRVVVLLAAQQVACVAKVHEVHTPDPSSASRIGGSNRVLHGRQRTEQEILDLVGVGGRGIPDEVRWEESSRAGDDGPDPTHGSNSIRSVASEWVRYTPKLGGS